MTALPSIRGLVAALAVAVPVILAGCGGGEDSGLLSQGRSDQLLELLDQAEQDFDDGECGQLLETLASLDAEVGAVSSEVDPELRGTLDTETDDLSRLASDCEQEDTTVTETAEPTTTEETTVEPTTEETEPTTEETDPEPEDEGPSGGDGDGGGNGEGNGDGEDGGGQGPGESGQLPPDAGGPDSGQLPPEAGPGEAGASARDAGGST